MLFRIGQMKKNIMIMDQIVVFKGKCVAIIPKLFGAEQPVLAVLELFVKMVMSLSLVIIILLEIMWVRDLINLNTLITSINDLLSSFRIWLINVKYYLMFHTLLHLELREN